MLSYLCVSVGGAIGNAARFWIKDAMLLRIFIGESKVIHYRHERPESQ